MSTSPGSSSTSKTSTSSGPTRSVIQWLLNVSGRDGQREQEFCPLLILSVQPDPPAIMLDDPPAHGQADAGAGVCGPVVQALEDAEDTLGVFRRDTDPVVGDREVPEAVVLPVD